MQLWNNGLLALYTHCRITFVISENISQLHQKELKHFNHFMLKESSFFTCTISSITLETFYTATDIGSISVGTHGVDVTLVCVFIEALV